MRKQPLLPAGQKNRFEFEALRRVQRHDRHAGASVLRLRLHHQRNMFKERGEVGKLLHRADELLQIFEPARGLRRAVLPPHVGIAGFLQNRSRPVRPAAFASIERRPAGEIGEEIAQRLALLRLQLLRLDHAFGAARINGMRSRRA